MTTRRRHGFGQREQSVEPDPYRRRALRVAVQRTDPAGAAPHATPTLLHGSNIRSISARLNVGGSNNALEAALDEPVR